MAHIKIQYVIIGANSTGQVLECDCTTVAVQINKVYFHLREFWGRLFMVEESVTQSEFIDIAVTLYKRGKHKKKTTRSTYRTNK